MTADKPRVACTDCGFEWFGPTAADGLRTVGHCTRCGGTLRFNEENGLPPIPEPVADMPAHLVLGNPRF